MRYRIVIRNNPDAPNEQHIANKTVIDSELSAKNQATRLAKRKSNLTKLHGQWEIKGFGYVRWHGSLCIQLVIDASDYSHIQ